MDSAIFDIQKITGIGISSTKTASNIFIEPYHTFVYKFLESASPFGKRFNNDLTVKRGKELISCSMSFDESTSDCIVYYLDRHAASIYVDVIRNQKINFLDALTCNPQLKPFMFLAYIKLSHILHGCNWLVERATTSDFWNGCIGRGSPDDPNFLSFHTVHSLVNGYDLEGQNRLFSLSSPVSLYNDEASVEKTFNDYIRPMVGKMSEILNSGYFDNEIKHMYATLNPLLIDRSRNGVDIGLIEYLSTTKQLTFYRPNYVERMANLCEP